MGHLGVERGPALSLRAQNAVQWLKGVGSRRFWDGVADLHAAVIECEIDRTAPVIVHASGRATRADAVERIDGTLHKAPARYRHLGAFPESSQYARLSANHVAQSFDIFHQRGGVEGPLGCGGVK